jgi:deoxyribose-phosphate aldolase
MNINPPVALRDLAKMIDHSLLHPAMTDAQIAAGCALARRYDVATACVKPYCVTLAREVLAGSDVGVCAVVAFPHGNSVPAIKVREAEQAMADGATEIDMVVNIGKVLGGVRTLDDLLRVRALGVARIGATATEAILEEARQRGFV